VKVVLFILIGFGIVHHVNALPVRPGADFLRPGTMSLAGAVKAPLSFDTMGHTSLGLEFTPEWSYFPLRGFEFSIGLLLAGGIAAEPIEYQQYGPLRWGAKFGTRYYFDVGQIFFPFVGVSFGADIVSNFVQSFHFWVEIPAGLLIMLNEHVGLQVGAPLKINVVPPLRLGVGRFEWTPGYLGVQAFF